METQQTFDYLFKIVLVGDSGTGKSCITNRFDCNLFLPLHETTIGVDFYVRTIEIDGKRVKLQIWDTAGQERFRTIVPNYYRSAQGVILVYDVSSRQSFDHLLDWLREVDRYSSEDADRVVIGNKCDVSRTLRTVDNAMGKSFAESIGLPFYETSARTGYNVDKVFFELAACIKRRVDASSPEMKKEVDLDFGDSHKRQYGCC